MGKRGPGSFKTLDVQRAIRSARDGGIEPAMIEIVARDGTIFRVYGDNAGLAETMLDAGAKAWDTETAKLKAKAAKG
jgi:hypothetical protein